MTPLALTPGPLVVIYSLHGHDFWRASRSAPAGAPSVVVPTRTAGVSAATHGERLPVSGGEAS